MKYEEGDIRKKWSEVEFVMPDSHEVRLLGKYNKMNRDETTSKYVNMARAAGMWLMQGGGFSPFGTRRGSSKTNEPDDGATGGNRMGCEFVWRWFDK